MSLAIKVENLSKAYQLGEIGTGTLGDDVTRWIAKVRGKEDPFLKIGEENDRAKKGSSDIVWSLKDINFEIQEGDAVGIIGRNGAGKSTLLKLLSRVTSPTTGEINVKGRIASLLEVGTGFHPELSGRDNIFLNGAILGMRKKEIQRRFDEIVDFSGVERYIDTPVKRYSSGMYVRLAFAVAAYLESEILIVDEVLAVGDAEFQKKCLGKMNNVSKSEGRTVLFVSHNMASVSNLCRSGILLKNGLISSIGEIKNIIEDYIVDDSENSGFKNHEQITFTYINPNIHIKKISLLGENGILSEFGLQETISCVIEYEITKFPTRIVPSIQLYDKFDQCILASLNSDSANLGKDQYFNKTLEKGVYKTYCKIPPNFLNESSYKISVLIAANETFKEATIAENVLTFQTHDTGEMKKEFTGTWIGIIRPKLEWNTVKEN